MNIYNELTLDVDDYGNSIILNHAKTALVQMYHIIIVLAGEAYPFSSIGIGLQDYQFNTLTNDVLDELSRSISNIFLDEIPILRTVTISIKKDDNINGLVIMSIVYNVKDDITQYGVDFRFNNNISNGISAFIHKTI